MGRGKRRGRRGANVGKGGNKRKGRGGGGGGQPGERERDRKVIKTSRQRAVLGRCEDDPASTKSRTSPAGQVRPPWRLSPAGPQAVPGFSGVLGLVGRWV